MKSYLFKLTPEIDKAKLKKQMDVVVKEGNKVAKKFSSALTKSFSVLKKTLTGGLVAGMVAKLVNPLQEINDTINSTLFKFDNIGRLADQFGVNARELQALSTTLQAKGLDQAQIEKILNNLQTEIGKTKSGDEGAKFKGLSENENALSLFAKLMDKIGKIEDVNQAKAFASEVFGEKEASRLFDALRSGEEFANIYDRAYKLSNEGTIKRQHDLQGYKDQEMAIAELQIANERAQQINQKTIDLQLSQYKSEEKLKTSKIGMYDSSAKTNELINQGNELLQQVVNQGGEIATSVIDWFKGDKKDKQEKKIKNNTAGDK